MATAYLDVLFQAFAEVRYGNSMDMASGNNLCSGNIGHMLPKGHRRLLPIFSQHLLVLWINISNWFPRKTYMRYIPANATFAMVEN